MKILPSTPYFRFLLVALMLFSAFAAGSVQAQEASDDRRKGAISQAELEQILAPIALYPDSILSHILVASTYPLEVVQAERWVLKNSELQGQEAVEAVAENDWDPSVQALVAFPQILKRLSQDLQWTQKLGDAFIQNEEQVLASVQNLRKLAEEAGSLEEMEKVTVTHDENSIIIEPREREVVYLPYYDTRVVYGPWRWKHYHPIYWGYPYADSLYYDDYYAHNRHSSFYWGPRISLSFGFFSNSFHWRDRHLVRISPRHYRPHRYYGHRDILRHRHAQRWVHNAHRRHGNRNRHTSRHNGQRSEVERRNQVRQPLSQEQIRARLIDRRDRHVAPNSSRRAITRQNRSERNRRTATNHRTENSRVVMPERARAVENNRRAANRPITRPVNRTRTAPAQPAPVVRPAPRQQQRVNRPAPQPRAVAAERKPASKPRATEHRERRQPR